MTNISSPQIALTNHLEYAFLGCYHGQLSKGLTTLGHYIAPIEQQLFSRAIGLLISPAAAVDLGMHLVMLPVAIVYAIGKSIVLRKCDFIIPQQHLQRIRDAVFPLLFGSLFGAIHPYLGTYAAEPSKKHVATGILLSGTNKDSFDAVCSPLTSMSEINTLISQLPKEYQSSEQEKKLLHQVAFWEAEFEKIQAIDFFTLHLTYKLSKKIMQIIDNQTWPSAVKEVAKRISLAAYPIFMAMDLIYFALTTTVCLGSLAVWLMGGQSGAYLEKAGSLEVLIYNIVKVPLFLISASAGLVAAAVRPELGITFSHTAVAWMAKVFFMLKMLGLKYRNGTMKTGDMIMVPAVHTYPDKEKDGRLPLLPSYGAHMRYILVKKTDSHQYQAELIERGKHHARAVNLTRKELDKLLEETLALRYQFGNETSHPILSQYGERPDGILDLGNQIGINNCIVTNLFAAIEVIRNEEGRNQHDVFCQHLKNLALRRYSIYAYDSYPFGKADDILKEIENLYSKGI